MASLREVTVFLAGRRLSVLTFAEPAPTASAAARAVGEIAKTVVFIVGGRPVAVVTAGDRKVRGAKLKRAAGLTGRVRLPAPAEVEESTGYRPGGVCPFLLPPDLLVVVDRSLRRFATVYPAAGDDHSAVPITVDDLVVITGGTEADVCEPFEPGG